MKYSLIFFAVILFFSMCVFAVSGQEVGKEFEVPAKHVSVLLVPDPKCPVQMFGPIKVIGNTYGGFEFEYSYQNLSNANIESVLTEDLSWFNGKGYSHPAEFNKNVVFSPFMILPTISGADTKNLTPFNEKEATKLGITDLSNKIWVIMIVKVKMSNGVIYDATDKYKKLEKFLDDLNLSNTMSIKESKLKEQKLRHFVSNLMTSND